jgi:AraC family transcriptional regulator
MNKYADFMKQIPENIMQGVERQLYTDIALFRPHIFIGGRLMHSSDYHIIIPSVPPPDSYINGRLKNFDKGKIVVMHPGDTILCTRNYHTKPYISLLIKPQLINSIAEEMDMPANVKFTKLQNPFSFDLMQLIRAFEKESKRRDSCRLIMDCLGIQIAATVLREFKTNLKKYPAYLSGGDSYVDMAVEYMQVFFSANITIEDICSEIGISPFHFMRLFKQKTGVSPHQYLLDIRIKKARELLTTGQYLVSEVAAMCGFINLSHFSSTFKRITGMPPSEYRK